MKGIITIDIKKCLACKSCELACAVAHSKSKELIGAINESPIPEYRIQLETVENITIPLQCKHCEDAPCVNICPSNALEKVDADSPVLINSDKCIGCKMCIIACPFGVINLDKSGKAIIKCDLCIERLKDNQNPACVDSCPTHAISFVNIDVLIKRKRKDTIKKYLVDLEVRG